MVQLVRAPEIIDPATLWLIVGNCVFRPFRPRQVIAKGPKGTNLLRSAIKVAPVQASSLRPSTGSVETHVGSHFLERAKAKDGIEVGITGHTKLKKDVQMVSLGRPIGKVFLDCAKNLVKGH